MSFFILASGSLDQEVKPKVHLMVVDGLNDRGMSQRASSPNLDRFAERDEKMR